MNTFSSYFAILVILLVIGPKAAIAQSQNEYRVIVNHEEQYSIWPSNTDIPKGWQLTDVLGNQAKCQAFIKNVWTDMRPLSIQKMNLPKDTEYRVVINHEEQYSIWPKKMPLPEKYKATQTQGTFKACMKHIKQVWIDMRPLSQRKGNIPR